MSRIATLGAESVKCPSFRHDLSAVNVFIGPNYGFKTARLEAIRLGLLGFVPGLPKTNQGIFDLSCGPSMSVKLNLSNGNGIERVYARKGETIKLTLRFEGKDWSEVPPVLMDAGEYLRLSERERNKYVFSLVNIGEKWTGETILRAIGETPIDCDKEIVEAVVLAKRAIFERLSASDIDRHENDVPIQTWLEERIEDLRQEIKTTHAALGRMEKYSQAAIELKAGATHLDAANVDRLLHTKTAILQALGEQLAVARQKQETARQNALTRAEIERRLSEPFDEKAIVAIRTQIAIELGPKVEGYKSAVGNLVGALADASGQVRAIKDAIERHEMDLSKLIKQYNLDLKAPKCPHCGAKGKKFKDAIEEQFHEREQELKQQIDGLIVKCGEARKTCEEAQNAYKAASEADKQAQSDKLLLQSLKGELNRLETLADNRATWQKQLDGLRAVEAPKESDIFDMTKTIALLSAEVMDLTDRQKRWVAAAHEQKRQAEAREARQAREAELIALKAIVKSVETIQAAMVTEAFGKILDDVNRFTNGILLSPLAYHDSEIGRWSVPQEATRINQEDWSGYEIPGANGKKYERISESKPQILPGGLWIPHRSFSGTEQLISCAGISVALARQSPIKIVLLDELGRLTVANKRKLVERLLALTGEGFIDQAVCVDVDGQAYQDLKGVNLIEI